MGLWGEWGVEVDQVRQQDPPSRSDLTTLGRPMAGRSADIGCSRTVRICES